MNRYLEIAAAADRRHKPKNCPERDAFAAENVAMPNTSAVHGKNKARRHIANIDQVHHEIEIQLNTPANEVAEHGRRRSEATIMRSNRHCRSANHHRQARCRRLQHELFG